MLSGIFGIFFGIFVLLFIILLGGTVVLLLRFIASLGGNISLMFGDLGEDTFARYSGWCIVPIALWSFGNSLISLMNIGII